MTRAGDRARYLRDIILRAGVAPNHLVDPVLADLDLTSTSWPFDYVLVRRLETGVVAHRADLDEDNGWWVPACGVDAVTSSWGDPDDRWTLLAGPIAALFGRACRRCSWPTP